MQEAIVDASNVNDAKANAKRSEPLPYTHMDDILHVGTEYHSINEIKDVSAIKDDYTHKVTCLSSMATLHLTLIIQVMRVSRVSWI